MSEHQIREVKAMCRTFCLVNKIQWTRKFERRYIKEFFETRKMNIKSISERRALGIHKERRKTQRHPEGSVLVPPPAIEGDPD